MLKPTYKTQIGQYTALGYSLRFKVYKYLDVHFFITAVADAVRTSLGPRGMDKMVGR